jgi:V8-like Glu-specific endopeptidase
MILFVQSESNAQYSIQAIYGEDNRKDIFDSPNWAKKLSPSVAAKIPKELMVSSGNVFNVTGTAMLGKRYCSKIRFAEQHIIANCTGFLIGNKYLATAAHCMKEEKDCNEFYWSFDVSLKQPGDASYRSIEAARTYQCKKVVARQFNQFEGLDFAIVELDRPVVDRTPLELDFETLVDVGLPIAMIGHASGLPLKLSDNAKVFNVTDRSFQAELDSFHGNSGSPIFNELNGKVIGITSMGHGGYVWDGEGSTCKIPQVCKPGDNCFKTLLSKITNLKEDFQKLAQ